MVVNEEKKRLNQTKSCLRACCAPAACRHVPSPLAKPLRLESLRLKQEVPSLFSRKEASLSDEHRKGHIFCKTSERRWTWMVSWFSQQTAPVGAGGGPLEGERADIPARCPERAEPRLHRGQDDPRMGKGPRSLAHSSAGHGWVLVLGTELDRQPLPNTSSSQPQLRNLPSRPPEQPLVFKRPASLAGQA